MTDLEIVLHFTEGVAFASAIWALAWSILK